MGVTEKKKSGTQGHTDAKPSSHEGDRTKCGIRKMDVVAENPELSVQPSEKG